MTPGALRSPQGGSLVVQAGRSGLGLFASRWAGAALTLVSTVVVARLLTPTDYGLIAMVAVVTGFGMLLMDAGLSIAAVQARELSQAQKSALFWVNTGLGLALATGMVGAAPALAAFYGRDELTGISRWLALTFVVNGLTTQFQAELTRNLRFAALATCQIASGVISLGTTIVVALLEGSYWALVSGMLVGGVVYAVLIVLTARWWPGLPRRHSDVRRLLVFGGGLTTVQVLNYLSQSVSTIVIGRFAGAMAAGLFSRAFTLLLIPLKQVNAPLGAVMVPVLSRLQDDPPAYERALRSATLLIGYSTVPLVAVAGGAASLLIPLVYGPQWTAATPIFAVLAIAGMARAYSNLIGWTATSLGLVARQLQFTVVSQSVTIAALVLGALDGPVTLAAAYAVTAAIAVPSGMWWVLRASQVRLAIITRTALPSLLLSVALYLSLLLTTWASAPLGQILTAAIVAVTVCGVCGVALISPRLRADAKEVVRLIHRLRRG